MSIFLALPLTALANVELVSFVGYQENDWARLDWETATELDNAGFFVLRNETGGNLPEDYEQIPVIDVETGESYTFIPARGDGVLGADYFFYDQNVSPNTTYYYLLQAVDSNNNSEYHGPESVIMSGTDATHTATPTNTSTLTPTMTPSPTLSASEPVTTTITVTPTPTITPSRTPSLTPSRTPTAPPTFPPFNTVTPTRTQSPTPGPTFTPTETPTETPSPTVTLHPLDLTLTAILAQITPLPSYTPLPPTRTPFPTFTPTVPLTALPASPDLFEGASASALWGLLCSGFLTLGGGGIFTYLYFLNRKREPPVS